MTSRWMDPELAAGLEAVPTDYRPNVLIDFDDLPGSRVRLVALYDMAFGQAQTSARVLVDERVVPGPAGGPHLVLRCHRPAASSEDRPWVYWIHPGGIVVGRALDEDAHAKRLVEQLECVVVVPEYRLAPEHPFPAPAEDCYAGYVHVLDHASEFGVDPSRVVVAGVSGGGGLAASLCLMVRDRGRTLPALQVLLAPMLDDRNTTPSSHEILDVSIWDRAMNLRAWRAYLGDLPASAEPPAYSVPARETDLAGLPPTFLDVGDVEVFRDEVIDYARRLAQADVATELHVWPGAYHGYDRLVPESHLARLTEATRLAALERALASRAS